MRDFTATLIFGQVLVTEYDDGTRTIATRRDASQTWGAPTLLVEEMD